MPSPTETLLRVQDSPVPTQTFIGFEGSTAMAPIDCTGCSSNTGLNVVAPSVDFHTPPLAAPTKSVTLPDGSVYPASAEMRPLMAADPTLRAPSPEIVPASSTGACSCAKAAASSANRSTQLAAASSIRIGSSPGVHLPDAAPSRAAGKWNSVSSVAAFGSALSN